MRHFLAAVLVLFLIIFASQTQTWKKFSCQRITKGEYLYGKNEVSKIVGYCRIPPADQGLECRRSSDCEEICNAQTKTCDFFRGGSMSILNELGNPVTIAE